MKWNFFQEFNALRDLFLIGMIKKCYSIVMVQQKVSISTGIKMIIYTSDIQDGILSFPRIYAQQWIYHHFFKSIMLR